VLSSLCQVARIQTEGLLLQLVRAELEARRGAGGYVGRFNALPHYLGYEGRCGLPTNFDAT
jgi:diphosphate-dependent phosphofructokinase